MNNTHKPIVGGISLLVIVMVLCMTVFSLLSISTAGAYDRMSRDAFLSSERYYAADFEAEIIFAKIRKAYESNSPMPDAVTVNGSQYSYVCVISDIQKLYITVSVADGEWSVERWQAVSEIEYDEDIEIWDGQTVTDHNRS